jgi:hypothetical protein
MVEILTSNQFVTILFLSIAGMILIYIAGISFKKLMYGYIGLFIFILIVSIRPLLNPEERQLFIETITGLVPGLIIAVLLSYFLKDKDISISNKDKTINYLRLKRGKANLLFMVLATLMTLIVVALILDQGWFGITLSVLLCLVGLFTVSLIKRNKKTQKEYLVSYDGKSTHVKEITGLTQYPFSAPVKLSATLIVESLSSKNRDMHYLVADYPIENEINIELCYQAEIDKFYQRNSLIYLIKTNDQDIISMTQIAVLK